MCVSVYVENTAMASPIKMICSPVCACVHVGKVVEKRKISYFGSAHNLIRHLISPNQDDLSYSARIFISGHQIG